MSTLVRPGSRRYSLSIAVVSLFALVLFNGIVTWVMVDRAEQRIETQNRVWCAVLDLIVRPTPGSAPSPGQLEFMAYIRDVQVGLGCPPV